MNTTTATTSSSQILHHTTAFVSGVISQSELRRHLVAILLREAPISDQATIKHLKLAAETVENAITFSSAAIRSSSLSLAEKLLLPLPELPLSSVLLSLVFALSHRSVDSAVRLLRIFHSTPSLARSEIAPILYDHLFSLHLLPVFRWFDEQRTRVLSNSSSDASGYEHSVTDESVVLPCTKLLSRMSGDQASKLRELEREYEEALDENCRVVAAYFEEVLVCESGGEASISPPLLMLKSAEEGDEGKNKVEIEETEMAVLENGRYNPIWSERETPIEFMGNTSSSKSSHAPCYPQRVSPRILKLQKSSKTWTTPVYLKSTSETESSLDENLPCSPSDSESESEEKDKNVALLEEPRQSQTQEQRQTIFKESRGPASSSPDMAEYDNPPHGSGKHTPPKDFVCPITSNIFDDPVTLETGQTYERKAIEEWFRTGNSTCPITRQKLQNTQLPKTNYVLKRLIASWKEQNPSSIPPPFESPYEDTETVPNSTKLSISPKDVVTQATVDGMISELRNAINNLYMSEILEESEMAVLQVEKMWRGVKLGVDIHCMLSKPPIINGFMEILFNSVQPQVLQAAVFLLAEMGSKDHAVIQTLTRVDTDVECIMALFNKGLTEAVVLLYLLKPSTTSLAEMVTPESLIEVFNEKEEDLVNMCLKPKTAALLLLAQIIGSGEERVASSAVKSVFSEKAIGTFVGSLGAEWAEERIAAVEILLRCMEEDGTCRNTIAENAELSPILESFIGATDGERFKIVQFFSELVKLNRRTFNEQILHIIKEEGPFSTMHTLLIFLQTGLQDQCPVMAGLLLQLDLLVEPRKMSIYREEAVDTLISCLRNTEFPAAQLAAADTIMSLQGRFNFSGRPLTREVLLRRAGIDKSSRSLEEMDQISNFCPQIEITPEEEAAANDWERKIASVLVSHEFGILFEALADGTKSRNQVLRSACFTSATWLIYMLTILPDTGVQGAARVCLLKLFIIKLNSAKDIDDRILSMLALNSFLHFPDGFHDLTSYSKDILKGLRELKRFSPLASEMIKVLVEENESKAEIWIHKELIQVDCSENGEVLSVICSKDKYFSGHSDGTIKVWTVTDSSFHLLQEIQEHLKAVTSLVVSESGDRLYSGSLDRTVKVWSIGKAAIHCVQVHDMRDHIHNLVVTNSISCFIPHGTGVKIQSWNGESKLLNSTKYVKCLAHINGRLYCGCHDSSVQEIDLATGTVRSIQSGSKKLLGKANPIHALQLHSELIYAATSSLDGSAIKMWNNANYSVVGSLQTGLEVRAMAVSSELICLGGKGGSVEIWDKKKHNRVDTLQTAKNSRVLCMALDCNEEILVIGTSNGQIQAWEMN